MHIEIVFHGWARLYSAVKCSDNEEEHNINKTKNYMYPYLEFGERHINYSDALKDAIEWGERENITVITELEESECDKCHKLYPSDEIIYLHEEQFCKSCWDTFDGVKPWDKIMEDIYSVQEKKNENN
jgi:hypothetical protein